MQRLDKIISSQLNISRSIARNDIRIGKVFVDGQLVRDPSFQTNPEKAFIKHCGQPVGYKEYVYILLNKPKGVLSASEDKKRETVVDLIPETLRRPNIAPVGRLDKDTTGLLILTDDGDFAHRVISPKKNVVKTYKVWLDGEVTEEMCEKFAEGITLADGTKCRPAELNILEDKVAEIKISEGKYHQIKRMFGTAGLGVDGLERRAIGKLRLPENLGIGQCRELTKPELEQIFSN